MWRFKEQLMGLVVPEGNANSIIANKVTRGLTLLRGGGIAINQHGRVWVI